MKRSVYECRNCPQPCRLVMLGEKLISQLICPGDGVDHAFWVKIWECEIPEFDKEDESKED